MTGTVRKCLTIGVGFLIGLLYLELGGASDYVVFVLTMIFMYSCLSSSLDLLVGLAGRMSFAHAAFFGIGAYLAGLLMIHWHWPFPVAALAGTAGTVVVALPIGLLTIRLHGMFFALATTALGISFISVTELHGLVKTTGGATGLAGVPTEPYLRSPHQFYLMFLVLLALALAVKVAISDSRIGARLIAQRDDEELALSLGIRTNRYKVFAFVVSAGLAGLTGCCFAIFFGSLAPADFNIWASFNVVVWVLVGGAGTLLGPVLGVALLWTTPQVLDWDPNVNLILYGLLLILVVTFRRGGIMGLYNGAAWLVRSRMKRRAPADAEPNPTDIEAPTLAARR